MPSTSDRYPANTTPTAVTDDAGDTSVGGDVSSGEFEPGSAVAGRSLSSFIQRGLRNCDFHDGPPVGVGSIIDDVNNPLPSWATEQDGDVVVTWQALADSPSGRVLRCDVLEDAIVTFYQWVYVGAPAVGTTEYVLSADVDTTSALTRITLEVNLYDRDLVPVDLGFEEFVATGTGTDRYQTTVSSGLGGVAWARYSLTISGTTSAAHTDQVKTTRLQIISPDTVGGWRRRRRGDRHHLGRQGRPRGGHRRRHGAAAGGRCQRLPS